MNSSQDPYLNFQRKVQQYKAILDNTQRYRDRWRDGLKDEIMVTLREAVASASLNCTIEERKDIDNLQGVILSLGSTNSGLGETVGDGFRRDLFKQNGALLYQQLFNGKIMVLITYPNIEKYSQPQPPKQIAIYRPEEVDQMHIIRHLEEFMTEITNWEDFDDHQIGEGHSPIGFKPHWMEKPVEPPEQE